MTNLLTAYLYAFMVFAYPTSNHAALEEPEVTQARYEALASDVAEGVSQPYVLPLFREKDDGAARAKTGLVLLATARFESSYVDDVVRCVVGGDKGHSWGPFQTQRAKSRVCSGALATSELEPGAPIPFARQTLGAVGVALEMMHESLSVTRGAGYAEDERLAEYTDGLAWKTERARRRSRTRVDLALRYWKEHPFVLVEQESAR